MYQYCYFGLWKEGQARTDEMDNVVRKLNRLTGNRAQVDQALATANAWLEKARILLAEAKKQKKLPPKLEPKIRQMGGPLPGAVKKALQKETKMSIPKDLPYKHKANITPKEPLFSSKVPVPANNVPAMQVNQRGYFAYSGHRNDICRLKPETEWDLYMDESGTDEDFAVAGKGIIAGVLCSHKNHLPEQNQFHACESMTEKEYCAGDQLIQTLLNQDQCGILAIPSFAYTSSQGWGSLIASYIDVVLRLLPLPEDNQKVKLNIHVERRAAYSDDIQFSLLRDACQYNLMHIYPERAKCIEFSIQEMDKSNPYNAYPDIIAHTCFRYDQNYPARQRLQATQWDGCCFLNFPADYLKNVLDYFFSGRNLSAEEWDNLLKAGANAGQGFLAAILRNIGDEARRSVSLWETYLNWTVNHLSSKAINLWQLKAQLNWLKEYQPLESELPPRLKLLWLTSQLAEANHLGEIEKQSPVGKEFLRLIHDLYEEDAPLVCFAVLHLAVQKTNAYQFEEARKLVLDFCDISSLLSRKPPFTRFLQSIVKKLMGDDQEQRYLPAAIPGLRYYGQLLSSCGQHEAFLGNHENALIYFKEAIRCFESLSEDKDQEIDQTRAYQATVQMDMSPNSPETLALLETYLGSPIETAAKTLAVTAENKDKYHHHILLRYLMQSQNAEGINAYLAQKTSWATGDGHPWEMIEFYRGLLLADPEERMTHLWTAYTCAKQSPGATLEIIACVIQGAIRFYQGQVTPDEMNQAITHAADQLPSLGAQRIQALRNQATQPICPLELAKIVLPFNFR